MYITKGNEERSRSRISFEIYLILLPYSLHILMLTPLNVFKMQIERFKHYLSGYVHKKIIDLNEICARCGGVARPTN